ncbi:c-type cytochrome [Pelagicoccus enzymogenes]|uniref:c-type cytochrome n=1 Tax=Pelagicoccus enzymogenes TaxID=2773457 RepID=UPI00280F3E1D|nr:c-type cytochrome [Pelagicoccus enzymogenes]MDQ8200442.1 c-type cytochrome [Pelagicoccus enzymogenes]
MPLTDPDLIAGQKTWSETCTTCHLTGLTGAPIIGNKAAWEHRIAKGLETLYDHALNGFIGPEYTEMPPKGGFAELSDDQVRQAVRFMTHLSQ